MPWVIVAFGRQTASLARTVGPRHRQGRPRRARRPGHLLHLRRRGDERLGRRHHDDGTACGASTPPARSRRRPGPIDMRLQRMLGHIPALLHKKPESVLVVACGAGITAGTLRPAPRRQAHRHLRHRAAGADHRDADVRHGELPRGRRHRPREPPHGQWQAGRGGLRRRPALPPHHPREVRHHHLRPDRPVGQGLRRARIRWNTTRCAAIT